MTDAKTGFKGSKVQRFKVQRFRVKVVGVRCQVSGQKNTRPDTVFNF